MKKNILILLISLLMMHLSFAQTEQDQIKKCSRPIRVAPEDWAPYSLISENNVLGMDIEIIKEIAKEAGCEVQFLTKIPRKRRLELFKKGKIDLLYAASKNTEREAYAYFTKSYRKESITLFVLEENKEKYNLSNFEELLLGSYSLIAPNAGYYGKDYDNYYKHLVQKKRILHYEEVNQGLKMLAAKRAEFLMGDYYSIFYYAGQQKIKISVLNYVPNDDLIYFMLSKVSMKSSDVDLLNKAIEKLQSSGVFKKIEQNYR